MNTKCHAINQYSKMTTFTSIYAAIEDDIAFGWVEDELTQEELNTWSDKHTCFVCTIEYQERQVTVRWFSMCQVPQIEDVLSSMVLDARSASCETFEEFCNEYGFNNDSIKDLKLYEACKCIADKAKYLLGDDIYDKMINSELDF